MSTLDSLLWSQWSTGCLSSAWKKALPLHYIWMERGRSVHVYFTAPLLTWFIAWGCELIEIQSKRGHLGRGGAAVPPKGKLALKNSLLQILALVLSQVFATRTGSSVSRNTLGSLWVARTRRAVVIQEKVHFFGVPFIKASSCLSLMGET